MTPAARISWAAVTSANSGRVVVRDWTEGRFEQLAGAVDEWFDGLRIIARDGENLRPEAQIACRLGLPYVIGLGPRLAFGLGMLDRARRRTGEGPSVDARSLALAGSDAADQRPSGRGAGVSPAPGFWLTR